MLRRWLSFYHPRYPRSLVYMLQASEYHVDEYLAWWQRAKDFRRVEYRKSLQFTAKAKLLLGLSYGLGLVWLGLVVLAALQMTPFWWLVALILLVLKPVFLAYGLTVVLGLVSTLIQRPRERKILRATQAKLAEHTAIKIAIAGSYGKTSMREIVLAVLKDARNVAAVPHSYNTPLGISKFVSGLQGDEDVLIFELGEYYPGDVRALCELVGPDIGIMTGVNEAHLEKFKSLEATVGTIFELADYLDDKEVYANIDNQLIAEAAQKRGWYGYSYAGCRGWKVSGEKIELTGTTATLTHGKTHIKLKSALLGKHNLGPLVAAAALGDHLGLNEKEIERGLEATQPFDHRMQPTYRRDGVVVIDDQYNGNPDGAQALIDFLSGLKGHRRLYITPGFVEMGEASAAVHRDLGHSLAESGIEVVGLVSNSVTADIEAGLEAGGFKGKLYLFRDGLDAAAGVEPLLKHGDVVAFQNDWPDNYV